MREKSSGLDIVNLVHVLKIHTRDFLKYFTEISVFSTNFE